MKKLILVLALFVVSLAFGQEENVSFNKKLVYKIDTINSTTVSGFRNIKSINYYHSNNYGLISVSSKYDSYYGNMFTLFDKSRFILVSIDAETRKVILPETINEDDVKINLIKTNEKAVINRVSCNYYQGNLDDKTIIKICVDEKSKINVLKNIFGENINGKILSFGMVKKGREKTTIFNLVEEKDIDFSVKLDNKDIEKAIAENKRKQKIRDSINTVREKEITTERIKVASDPLYNMNETKAYKENEVNEINNESEFIDYNIIYRYRFGEGDEKKRKKDLAYIKLDYKSTLKNALKSKNITKEEYKKLIKFFKEYIKEVEAYDPEKQTEKANEQKQSFSKIEKDNNNAEKYPKYKSNYKTMYMAKKPSLAVTKAIEEGLGASIPQFCSNIEEKISVFKNEELKKQMVHFLGQTCDLYLHPKVDYVDYEATLESLRRSVLEIEKLRSKLSKKDKKNLSELIYNLD